MRVFSRGICLTSQLRLPRLPHRNNKSPLKLELLQRSGLQRRLSLRLYQKCSVNMRRLSKRTLKRQSKNFLENKKKPKKKRKPRKRLSSLEKLQKPRRRNRVEKRKN